jgi:FkbM family methyltransferase
MRKAIRLRRMASVRARRQKPRYRDKNARHDFFLYRAGLYTPLLGVESDIGLICVSPYDYGQSRRIFVNRRISYRPLEHALETARSCGEDPASNGRVFLDVGANIGIVTVTALKRHGFRKVVSIEPEPGNFRLLEVNVTLNRGDAQVRTFNVAVSSDVGEAPLLLNKGSHGEHALVTGTAAADSPDVVKVRTRPLDDVLADAGHRPEDVGFLKIDTEGHEPRVLGGAASLLSAGPPTMIEYAPFRYRDPDYGLDLLERIVAEHYSHFLDLRRAIKGQAELRSISELADLRREITTTEERRITDLLLVRR